MALITIFEDGTFESTSATSSKEKLLDYKKKLASARKLVTVQAKIDRLKASLPKATATRKAAITTQIKQLRESAGLGPRSSHKSVIMRVDRLEKLIAAESEKTKSSKSAKPSAKAPTSNSMRRVKSDDEKTQALKDTIKRSKAIIRDLKTRHPSGHPNMARHEFAIKKAQEELDVKKKIATGKKGLKKAPKIATEKKRLKKAPKK